MQQVKQSTKSNFPELPALNVCLRKSWRYPQFVGFSPVLLPTGPIKSSVVLKFRLKDRHHYGVRQKNSSPIVNEEGYDAGRAAIGLDHVVFHFRCVCSRTLPCLRKRLLVE